MSSQKKCPKCGHINKADMPLCTKCGAPLPVEDEAQLMRETMGASYDLKWAVVGAVIILALQFGTIAVIWKVAGKKFLAGPPRRSLLEATIESVEPNYGQLESNEEVKISIKLDQAGRNTADKVQAVYFGSKKAKPYLREKVERKQKSCKEICEEGKKADQAAKKCKESCDKAKETRKEADECAKECREKCGGECTEEKLLTLSAEDRQLCEKCPEKRTAARKLEAECETCDNRVEYLMSQKRNCDICTDTLAELRKDLEKCKKDGAGCYSVTAFDKRQELKNKKEAKPEKKPGEKDEAFQRRMESWERDVEQLEEDIEALEETNVYAFVPTVEEPKVVPVKLEFTTGYEVAKSPGYFYVKDSAAGKPEVKKKKREKPTSQAGFWIMLAASMLIYFLGGMVTGRLSPGITMKEPATAGGFSGIIYFGFLLAIGADFSVVIFSAIIGIPAFALAAYIGGWAGEKWQGTI
jgi:hypothetical protein